MMTDGRRLDDIGRIEAAAEADLDDRHICRMFGKEQKGDGRQDLEDGDLLPVVRHRHAADRIR